MNNEERALAYAQDIARFIRHETVQRPGSEEAFAALHEEMRALFPEVHRVCERVEVDGSLMYRWPGESSDDALLLMSHHDVVAANADEWSCDPFAGEIRDGKLWGRGTLDVKGNLYCIFRAVEELIDEGFTPAHECIWSRATARRSAATRAFRTTCASMASRWVCCSTRDRRCSRAASAMRAGTWRSSPRPRRAS